MHFKQGDLFWGMSKDFVKEAMDIAIKISRETGDFLFREGDQSNFFYILLKGRVMLSLGEEGSTVYVARHPGELIGWSALTSRAEFSASAKCMIPSSLLKFDRDNFMNILDKDFKNAAMLYKRLSESLGKRLLEIYPSIV